MSCIGVDTSTKHQFLAKKCLVLEVSSSLDGIDYEKNVRGCTIFDIVQKTILQTKRVRIEETIQTNRMHQAFSPKYLAKNQ